MKNDFKLKGIVIYLAVLSVVFSFIYYYVFEGRMVGAVHWLIEGLLPRIMWLVYCTKFYVTRAKSSLAVSVFVIGALSCMNGMINYIEAGTEGVLAVFLNMISYIVIAILIGKGLSDKVFVKIAMALVFLWDVCGLLQNIYYVHYLLVVNFCMVFVLVLVVCFVWSKLPDKVAIKIIMAIASVLVLYWMAENIQEMLFLRYLVSYWMVEFYTFMFDRINILAFDLSLFLFILKNQIPPVRRALKSKKQSEEVMGISSELQLIMLKEKFERGCITEDEYKLQKTRIIQKL